MDRHTKPGAVAAVDLKPVPEICVAARSGNVERLETVIKNDEKWLDDYDPNTGYYPLHCAVIGGHLSCAQLLLSQPKVQVNMKSAAADWLTSFRHSVCSGPFWSSTALHLAARATGEHALAIARLLLDHGADITIVTYELTPFEVACQFGSAAMVELLLQQCRDALLRGNEWRVGWRPHRLPHCYAAKGLNEQVLGFLFEYDRSNGVRYSVSQLDDISNLELFQHVVSVYEEQNAQRDESLMYELMAFGSNENLNEKLALLFRRGYEPFSVDPHTGQITFRCLAYRLPKHRRRGQYVMTTKTLCLDFVPAHIVRRFNEQCVGIDMTGKFHPLVDAFLAAAAPDSGDPNSDFLRRVLRKGFDPRQLTWRLHRADALFCKHPFLRRVARVAGLIGGRYGIVAHAVLQSESPVQLRNVMQILIDSGFKGCDSDSSNNSDGTTPDKTAISTMLMLILKCGINSKFTPVLRELLRSVNFDLNYRRSSSPFTSPDAVVIAALIGNSEILAYLMSRTATDPDSLVEDMVLGASRLLAINQNAVRRKAARRCLKQATGVSAYLLFRLGAKRDRIPYLHAMLAPEPGNVDDSYTESRWKIVLAQPESSSLWQLSSAAIFKQLIRHHVVVETTFNRCVGALPLPATIRERLKFKNFRANVDNTWRSLVISD